MPTIFISYRRADTGYVATMVAERFKQEFGEGSVFLDVDNIPLGMDFRVYIDQQIAKSDILVVLIGDSWLTTCNELGKRRIDDENDFVRIEIESALKRDILVIPVLAETAKMPLATELPGSLSSLAYRNATELRSGRDLRHHLDTLAKGIQQLLAAMKPVQKIPSPPPVMKVINSVASASNPTMDTSAEASSPSTDPEPIQAEIVSETKITNQNLLPRPAGDVVDSPFREVPGSRQSVALPFQQAPFSPNNWDVWNWKDPKSIAICLFLLYKPKNLIVAFFHFFFYAGMVLATLFAVNLLLSATFENDQLLSLFFRLVFTFVFVILTYGVVYFVAWMPARLLNRWMV